MFFRECHMWMLMLCTSGDTTSEPETRKKKRRKKHKYKNRLPTLKMTVVYICEDFICQSIYNTTTTIL